PGARGLGCRGAAWGGVRAGARVFLLVRGARAHPASRHVPSGRAPTHAHRGVRDAPLCRAGPRARARRASEPGRGGGGVSRGGGLPGARRRRDSDPTKQCERGAEARRARVSPRAPGRPLRASLPWFAGGFVRAGAPWARTGGARGARRLRPRSPAGAARALRGAVRAGHAPRVARRLRGLAACPAATPSPEPGDPGLGHPVELLVTDKASYRGSGEHWRNGEARQIAARVRELVDTGEAEPGDIVVLFAAGTDAERYEEALRREDLPTYRATGRGYFGQQQVADLLAYLRLLHNRYDDVALASVLASPFVGVSNDALVLLRRAAPRRPLYTALERELPEGV